MVILIHAANLGTAAAKDNIFQAYTDAAPTALRKGGRETLKEKLKPYLQTGEWSE